MSTHPSPGWGLEPWGQTDWGGHQIPDGPGPLYPNYFYQKVPNLISGPVLNQGLAADPALTGYGGE